MNAPSRIAVAGPDITDLEIAAVAEAAREGFYEGANTFQTRFESAFASHVGLRHAVALPSCTSALHLALSAMNIGPGDEVIVPDITWIATVAPVIYRGATPVFADVDPVSHCISPESVEAKLSPRTKAIIGVDLYGTICDWPRLHAIARRTGVKLIEDAAEAVGSTYLDRPAGSFADVGTFSFHGSKTMTTGEGGMLVTDDDAIIDRVRRLRDHGRAPNDFFFENEEVGFKYRMSATQAALGLTQLQRLDELVAKKRHIYAFYRGALSDVPGLSLNADLQGLHNSYWMTTATWDERYGVSKREMMQALSERGIDSRPFFNPLSALPALAHLPTAASAREENVVARRVSARGINLPSALRLDDDDLLWSACVFAQALTKHLRTGEFEAPAAPPISTIKRKSAERTAA